MILEESSSIREPTTCGTKVVANARSKNLNQGLTATLEKFGRQTLALTLKNLKLTFRNYTSIFAQLWIGVLFLILLIIIGIVIQSFTGKDPTFISTKTHSDENPPERFPSCTPGTNTGAICYSFGYATSRGPEYRNDTAIENLIDLMALKLGVDSTRNVPDGILSFPATSTSTDVNTWILNNPNITRGIIIFENSYQWYSDPASAFRYIYRSNSTQTCGAINIYNCDDPWLEYHIPLISAANSAFTAMFGGNVDTQMKASFSNFPHPSLPVTFDAMETFGCLFIYIALTFNYVVLLISIVREKELHLVESMRQMGMMISAYWASWLISTTIINCIMVFLLVIFGVLLQFDLFHKTSALLLLVILYLSAQAFTAIAFFFSSFIRTTGTARVVGLMIFIGTFISAPLMYTAYFTNPAESYNTIRWLLSILPFYSFYNALQTVINRASGSLATGTSWEDRLTNLLPPSPSNLQPTYWSINSSLEWLLVSFFIFTLAAWYIEQVIPNNYGRSKKLWFIFQPSFWFGKQFRCHHCFCRRSTSSKIIGIKSSDDIEPPSFNEFTDEDVKIEANQIYNQTVQPNPAVTLRGVTKTFSNGWFSNSFTAVNKVFYGMNYGQLTAILGHNGSGKSTTFNMLTGLLPITSGKAEIFGRSVLDDEDMSELHASMGVCPQYDVLWDHLTAREHLELFARVKGLDGNIQEEANRRLAQVKLTSTANNCVRGFSGGMKRRLSIAIAMLGEPSIVFLDEPTTGMDPVTKREVLEMISQSKQEDRVIILTSHAMEEVEMLADKVIVMSHGTVQAVGTVVRLKKRFGLGYKMTIFGANKNKIENYLKQYHEQLQSITQVNENLKDETVVINFPNSIEASSLIPFFTKFEADKNELGVIDYSLSLSTLEEVFLNLSQSEEDRDLEKINQIKSLQARFEQCAAYQPSYSSNSSKVTISSQANALFWKSITSHMRNWSCCWTILFPVIVMIGLAILDKYFMYPQRLEAVCGPGVTAEDCESKGLNLTCAANLAQYEPIITPDQIIIGTIDLSGDQGQPINANCNDEICYTGLEKMDVRKFPLAFSNQIINNPGYLNQTYNTPDAENLFNWHANLLFILNAGQATCETNYTNAFSVTVCPTNPPDAYSACVENKRLLIQAKEYWDSQSPQAAAADGLQTCLGPSGIVAVPSKIYTNQVNELAAEYAACQENVATNLIIPYFSAFNLSGAIANTNQVGTGLMKSFSTNSILNAELKTINEYIWTAVDSLGSDNVDNIFYQQSRTLWFDSIGADPTDTEFIPTIAQICSASVTDYGFIYNPFEIQLLAICGSQENMDNLCAVFSNLDQVRGTSVNSFQTNRNVLDLNIYDSWFGAQVQTPYMKKESLSMLIGPNIYLQRQYYSKYGGIYVTNLTSSNFEFVLYSNLTAYSDNENTNWIQLVNLAESAFVRSQINREIFMRTQEMSVKFVCNRNEWLNDSSIALDCDLLPAFLRISVIDYVGLTLFPFLFFTYAFLIVNQIVYEKEQRLRVIIRMNGGMKNSVYWVVSFIFFYFQFLAMAFFIYFFGRICSLRFVSLHDPGVYWSFVIMWGALLVVFSFFLSLFFSSTQAATPGVFLLVLVTNLVGIQIISYLIQDPYSTNDSYGSLMWLPPFPMIRIISWMALAATVDEKIYQNQLLTFGQGAIGYSLLIMFGEFCTLCFLVWYLDQVYIAQFGTRMHPLFFLNKKYWKKQVHGTGGKLLREYQIEDCVKNSLNTINQPDVVAEYERVIDEKPNKNLVVRAVRLHKKFENGHVAVKSLSLGINENECFGLLGHNGAGKTTLISMLVGLFEPTSGTALVDGMSINNDMDAVQRRMGVCAQHDVCWDDLSVRDHLLFYARLKGVPNNELGLAVDKALFDVKLKQFEHRSSKKLSGGMRRRLSVAMSLIGTPRVVYLDEPSTGLDPVSKRALWNVIAKAKGNKSLVLTTHSMEEAEALCDRIGIMALGELQCVGTAAQLKQRYGTGYTFFIATRMDISSQMVNELIHSLFGVNNAKIVGRGIGGTYKFEVSRNCVILSKVFAEMESLEVQEKFGILDWSLTETTLEEVFVKLADLAHVDDAMCAASKNIDSNTNDDSFYSKLSSFFSSSPSRKSSRSTTHTLSVNTIPDEDDEYIRQQNNIIDKV